MLPLPPWNKKSLKSTTKPQMFNLYLLVTQAMGHIVLNISPYTALPIMIPHILIHLYFDQINIWDHGPHKGSTESNPQLLEHKYNNQTLKPLKNLRWPIQYHLTKIDLG